MLEVRHIHVSYGPVDVLRDVSLHVHPHEIVGVIGPNGAGKSTLVKGLTGLLRPWSPDGRHAIVWDGKRIDGLPPHEIARRGVAVVPEGSRIFPHMTVLDNLKVGSFLPGSRRRRAETLARVFDLFPRLAERTRQAAGTLSGGERQMLAIGRALMALPRLLILDEPSLGIAPKLVKATMDVVAAINREGISVLLVEQNVPVTLRTCRRVYVLENGAVVREGTGAELLGDETIRRTYLGVEA